MLTVKQAIQDASEHTIKPSEERRLDRIIFTTKMIQRLLRGDTRSLILKLDPDLLDNKENLLIKAGFYYVAEPFFRHYRWQNGMFRSYKRTYASDAYEIFADTHEEPAPEEETLKESLQANAMLESESRFILRVKSCKIRILGKLKQSKYIHPNLYDLSKRSRVMVVDFELVTRDFAYKELERIELEKWFDEAADNII